MNVKEYIQFWADSYKKDLTENIMPFWMEHGLDRKHGGVYTCVNRDGSLIDTTKSVWFQGRFAFICAYAYNNVEHKQEWLDAAKSTLDFIEHHCFDTDGHMFFSVTEDGTPLRKRRYVFSETFATIAMSEYALATGDKTYAEKALKLFKDTQRFLETPGFLTPKYEPAVDLQGHSIVMILINVGSRLLEVIDDPNINRQIDESIEKLRTQFMHPEFKALLESVGPNGEFVDTCMGRTINPGHCIETSWFLMDVAKNRGWDKNILDTALTIFDWSWDWGWDKEYGGIIRHGAKMLYAYCEATVPKITLILRKAYGGAYIGMCNKELGADMVMAWPSAQIAVMGASGAVNIISSVKREIRNADDPAQVRAEKIAEYEETFNNPYVAASLGYVDDIIEPASTRQRVISALDMLSTKRESLPAKKHGNIPL